LANSGSYASVSVTFTEYSQNGAQNPQPNLLPDDLPDPAPEPPFVIYPVSDVTGGVGVGETLISATMDNDNNGAFLYPESDMDYTAKTWINGQHFLTALTL